MNTLRQTWENEYVTHFERTEYNKKRFAKRVKQLLHMKDDEDFLDWLMANGDALEFLAKSGHFDDYIGFQDGEPHLIANKFGVVDYMSKMVSLLLSDKYMNDTKNITRGQAKRYVELYIWYKERTAPMREELEELPF